MDVELRDIHKRFGLVRANDGISLHVPAGTIQGILGENGAGKSTLMKILSGYQPADRGRIILNGRHVLVRSPADAIRAGVGMLHQDPMDFPPLTVLEDSLIGVTGIGPRFTLQRREALATLQSLAEEFGFSLDPHREIRSLTVGERQQLELLRLLGQGAGVLILDEPTTGISAPQREMLFATLRRLADEGKTILFVSHKLDEVSRLCDRVAVLRQGRLVGEATAPFASRRLVAMMFGKEVAVAAPAAIPPGPPVLTIEDLTLDDGRLEMTHLNLELRAGEVLGLAGMEGSGQRLLLQACAGLVRPAHGSLRIGQTDLTGKPYRLFHELGVAYVPAARLEEGLVPGLSFTEHIILAGAKKAGFIDWSQGEKEAAARIVEFNIRGQPSSRVESLSGGNQQRALLALVRSPLSLLLLEHPTRGLDVESTIYLWGKMQERLSQGTGIVFISAELEELLTYSDRIAVFFAGRMMGPFPASGLNVEQLGQLIGGKGVERV